MRDVHLASLREPSLEQFPVGGGSNKRKVHLRIRNLASLPVLAINGHSEPGFGMSVNSQDRNVSWNEVGMMDEYCGLPATITKLYNDYAAYVDVDDGKWVWPFDWLTPISRG